MSELYRDFIEDQFDRVVNAINNELPTPTQADIGKVVQVASDGGSGAEYALDAVPNELPTPTTSDIDKVVKVISDGSGGAEYSLDNETQELPTPTTADIGKFATVVSDGSGGAEYSLDSVPQELPTPASTNIGKVATVVSDGSGGYEWGAETPSGLPAVTTSDKNKILQVKNGSWIIRPKYLTIQFNSMGGTNSVSLPAGYTRNDLISLAQNGDIGFYCELYFMPADYSYQFMGTLSCYCVDTFSVDPGIYFKGRFTATNNKVYEVVIKVSSKTTPTDTITVTAV